MSKKRKGGVKRSDAMFKNKDLDLAGDCAHRWKVNRVALVVLDTNVQALPGTDLETGVYHKVMQAQFPAYAYYKIECYALHVPLRLQRFASSQLHGCVAHKR